MKARVAYQLSDEYKYSLFEEFIDDTAITNFAVVLYCEHLKRADQSRAYRKKMIQQMFNDYVAAMKLPNICGQEISTEEVIAYLQKEYDIDLDRIRINKETKQEYDRRMRKK